MARRRRSVLRRLALHASLMMDAIGKVMFDPRRPHQRVFVDGGGMYSFGDEWPSYESTPDVNTRMMRVEAELVYLRDRVRTLEAEKAKRKRYHKFHAAKSWGR